MFAKWTMHCFVSAISSLHGWDWRWKIVADGLGFFPIQSNESNPALPRIAFDL
jgi:hypothetical protein